MEESKKKKGLFNKFFSVLSGKPAQSGSLSNFQKGKFAPNQKDPVDLVFVKNFTRSGGKFLYCEDEKDAYSFLKDIFEEAGINQIYCCDTNLQSILDKVSMKYDCTDMSTATAFCSSCEFLVSFNGGIMISDKQSKGKKLNELPAIFLIIARTSQIVGNLREGLTGIREKYKGDIPANITTIKGPIKEDDLNTASLGATCTKDIYLLLLEDQI